MVDQLAAKYGDVIDYYLHGGKSAIENGVPRGNSAYVLGFGEGRWQYDGSGSPRIEAALGILDRDPHYMYESDLATVSGGACAKIRLGHELVSHRPVELHLASCRCHRRCAASIDERPITIEGTLDVSSDPAFAAAVRVLRVRHPVHQSRGHLHRRDRRPWQYLGGALTEATIRTSPVSSPNLGSDTELTYQLLGPDEDVLAQADVDRTDQSSGSAGLRTVLTEVNQAFEIVAMVEWKDRSMRLVVDTQGHRGPSRFTSACRCRVSCRVPAPELLPARAAPPYLLRRE